MTQIEQIQSAIQRADAMQSKLTPEVMAIGGFTSVKIRHLMNNLGAISTAFLEIGSLRGATFCSTIFKNDELGDAHSIDMFCEFVRDDEVHPMKELLSNVASFKPPQTKFKLINEDCWGQQAKKQVDGMCFDLYLFDGPHDYESQRKALVEYRDCLANEFIFCVDDYSTWVDVSRGTQDSIKDAKMEVLHEWELYNGIPSDASAWWNGYYVSLLRKM